MSSRNYNSIEKKRSADETCETKNKFSQEKEFNSKINIKLKELNDINEKIDMRQSIDLKLNQNEKEIILKSSKLNEYYVSKIEAESKNESSKIEPIFEDMNYNKRKVLNSKMDQRDEIPRDIPSPTENNIQHSCYYNNRSSIKQDKGNIKVNETERLNSFEIEYDLKMRRSVLSNDSKPPKKQTLELKSRREDQENEKYHFSILSDKSDQTWRLMKITSFIPYQKILEADDSKLVLKIDDLIFHSELYKVTLPETKNKLPKPFSLKFSVLTKTQLKNYKSKEAYFRLAQPSIVLKLNNVISCDTVNIDQSLFKKDKTLKYFFFYVKYLFNEEKIEIKTINSNGSDPDSSKFNSRIVNFNEENKRIKGKKINLLQKTVSQNRKMSDNGSMNDYKDKKLDTNFDFNNCLVFASFNKTIMDRWVCAINHFIKK